MKKPSDEIIYNVLNEIGTKEEASMVVRWLATDEGQLYLSEQMDEHFRQLKEGFEEISIPHAVPSEQIWAGIEKKTSRRKFNIRRSALRIAAVLVPFLFVAGIAIFSLRNTAEAQYAEIFVPHGERVELTLPDGTRIHLNSGTKFSYPEKFAGPSRLVVLDGEAYFDVTKDKKHPFVVELSNNSKIEVLGTAFNVKAYSDDDEIDIALDNGRINLVSADSREYELLPEESLVYNKNTAEVIVSKNSDNASAWKDGIISFDDTPLCEVMTVLKRWYDVDFEVEDADALNYSYTITTKKVPLEELLSDFEKISPLKFTFGCDTVKIQMK